MIYVVAGTLRHPFPRLLLSMNRFRHSGVLSDELYGQYGSFRPEFRLDAYAVKQPMFPYAQHIKWIQSADIVVAEAGEDIVLLSLMLGKVPIVLPRRKAEGEHVDDHQCEFAQKLEELHQALVVYAEYELQEVINSYTERVAPCLQRMQELKQGGEPKLQTELAGVLENELFKGLNTMQMANI